jgi:hypothetical protein
MYAKLFPFWMVYLPGKAIPVLHAGKYLAAFSTAQQGTTYMVNMGATAWEFKLMSRGTFLRLLPDLRAMGLKGVCLDPAGEKWERRVSFEEIEKETGSSAELPALPPQTAVDRRFPRG